MAPTRAAAAVVIMMARIVRSGRQSIRPTAATSSGETVFDTSRSAAPAVVATAGPTRRRTPKRGRVTDRVTARANVEQAKRVCTQRPVSRCGYFASAGVAAAGVGAGGGGGFSVTRKSFAPEQSPTYAFSFG